ncbi:MAG: hypothetical protein AAGA77_06400 [Bacteroidota bacterium]
MSHNEFERKAREAFHELNEQDLAEAMQARERVWNALNSKTKKYRRYWGLLWFLLGLLLAIGGMCFKNMLSSKVQNTDIPIAKSEITKNWEIELKSIRNEMADLKQKYQVKNQMFDSLTLQHQKLFAELQGIASSEMNSSSHTVQIQYEKDTIYVTKVNTEVVEKIKTLRDTVFIEVPIMEIEDDLMTAIDSDLEKNGTTKENKSNGKYKRTSVQFNFRNNLSNK